MRRSFTDELAAAGLFLLEGSVYERLRRHAAITYDEWIAQSGLIYDEPSRRVLGDVHREYVREAVRAGRPMVVSAATWRASRERVARSRFADRDVNRDQVAFARALCREAEAPIPLYVAGALGPHGDAYRPEEALTPDASRELHAWQADALADAGADLLLAMTLPAVAEARGLARAMAATRLPYLLSFVVRDDGTILDGTPLSDALAIIDAENATPPFGYGVNCVHPRVLDRALAAAGPAVVDRVIAYRANTSTLRPEELDGATALVTQSPSTLADEIRAVASTYGLKLLGGCCGTGTEHIAAISLACGR